MFILVDTSVLPTVDNNVQAMWHMGERVIPRALAGRQMSSDSCADPNSNQFLRHLFFLLLYKTKAHKNFEIKLILKTRA